MFGRIRSLFDQPNPTDGAGRVYDSPKEKTETETRTVTTTFTEYRVRISYDDRTETKYVTDWSDHGQSYKFYEGQPELTRHYKYGRDKPSRYIPLVKINQGEPFVVSLSKAEAIDIEESDEFVAVVEDVEVEVHYEQYEEGGEWEEQYIDFEMPDEYEITEWHKVEWEAVNE